MSILGNVTLRKTSSCALLRRRTPTETTTRTGSPAGSSTGSSTGAPRWKARQDAAAELLAWVARNGPAGVSSHPAVEAFEGLGGALAYLHGRWIVYFGVALDEEAEGRAGSLADSAVRAWERTTSRHQDLARILSHHRTHPAVRAAEESHLGMLAGLSGSPATGFPSFLL